MSYGTFGSEGTSVSSAASARSGGSSVSRTGGAARLEEGRKPTSSRTVAIAATSLGHARCATPDVRVCVRAPPSCSASTASLVTVLTTSGPVTNMYEECSTMRVKSVIAGE